MAVSQPYQQIKLQPMLVVNQPACYLIFDVMSAQGKTNSPFLMSKPIIDLDCEAPHPSKNAILFHLPA